MGESSISTHNGLAYDNVVKCSCVTWARDTLGEIERCFSEFTTKGEGRFLDTSAGVSGFELVSSVAFFPSGNATGCWRKI